MDRIFEHLDTAEDTIAPVTSLQKCSFLKTRFVTVVDPR